MTTERKPRVAVTLSDETRELVNRLAELEGTSASRVVAGIVEEFAPTIRQLIDASEAVKKLSDQKRAEIAAAIERMEPELLEQLNRAQSSFNAALGLAKGE